MHIVTQGLVLRETNYKEADKILTVLTREGGKRTVKARGCRRRNSPLAASAFTLGAANLVGIPLLSVFMTKLLLANEALAAGGRHTAVALTVLAISTLLNAQYFLGTATELFIPRRDGQQGQAVRIGALAAVGLIGFIALNLILGFFARDILAALADGLARFA